MGSIKLNSITTGNNQKQLSRNRQKGEIKMFTRDCIPCNRRHCVSGLEFFSFEQLSVGAICSGTVRDVRQEKTLLHTCSSSAFGSHANLPPSNGAHLESTGRNVPEERKVSRRDECHFLAWLLKSCKSCHILSPLAVVQRAKIQVALEAPCWKPQRHCQQKSRRTTRNRAIYQPELEHQSLILLKLLQFGVALLQQLLP